MNMFPNRFHFLVGLSLLVVVALTCTTGYAQEKQKAPEPNLFAVPKNASGDELGQFLESLRTRPATTAKQERQRVLAVNKCSVAILRSDAQEKYQVLAAEAQLGVLGVIRQVDPEFTGPTQTEFAAKLATSPKPEFAIIGKVFPIAQQVPQMHRMTRPIRTALIEEAFALAKTYGVNARTFSLLRTSMALELESKANFKEAGNIYKRLVPMVATSSDERLINYGPKLKAAADRCLTLRGNPIQLAGTLQDGTEFDWSKYRGKVVLIDFWATWCGPCTKDMPRIKAIYKDYRDRGFEIVGINMDSNQDKLRKYLTDNDIPWPQLVGDDENFGWKHPVVLKYGINSVPTQMLVDKDGKVVALSLKGRDLENRLLSMLPGK
ncbi:MAG: TlpA family protein disulfide reductase [Planctomycetaceae bacterium]